MCHRGLQAAFADIGEDSRPIWVAGHSLGGAAAQILQCTQLYAASRVYTYGAPRVFRGYVPEALRVSVRRITDPVVYGPFGFNHPSSDTIWVRYPGSVRSQIPLRLKPLAAAYRTAVWSRGLIQTALASLGVPVRPTLADGHSMHRYRRDLYPLR
ncbi:lipase family protein [Porticoccus sp.]